MKNRTHRFCALVVVLCLTLSACVDMPVQSGAFTMTTQSNDSNRQQAADQLNFCSGRFLISAPLGSRVTGGNYKYGIAKLDRPMPMSHEEFTEILDQKESALKTAPHETENSLLRRAVRIDSSSRVLVFWKTDYAGAIVEVEGYRWTDDSMFVVRNRAGMSPPDDGTVSRQDIAIAGTRETLAQLRRRADNEIPSDPGFCFDGGFIASAKWKNEQSWMDIGIAQYPDVHISLHIFPLSRAAFDKPLLDRVGGALVMLGNMATSVHVLRKGDRQVGPFKGQEYLVSAPASGGMRAHSFNWETQGEGTYERPFMNVEMTTGNNDKDGNPQQTRLSNEEALRLWDSILGSLRVRPVDAAPSPSSDATPPSKPLGELAVTGRQCPQTGWWENDTANAVPRDRRRFFREGERMPHAVATADPNLWDRIRGKQPRYSAATMWTLVAYGPPPEDAPGATH